jgi:hypothetical protein
MVPRTLAGIIVAGLCSSALAQNYRTVEVKIRQPF